jgi:hypothetical protein
MTVRWFVTAGLIALPLLAQAECGWLLMTPPVTPMKPVPLEQWFDIKFQEGRFKQINADLTAPLKQWGAVPSLRLG